MADVIIADLSKSSTQIATFASQWSQHSGSGVMQAQVVRGKQSKQQMVLRDRCGEFAAPEEIEPVQRRLWGGMTASSSAVTPEKPAPADRRRTSLQLRARPL